MSPLHHIQKSTQKAIEIGSDIHALPHINR